MSVLSGIIEASRNRGSGAWSELDLSPAVWVSNTGADASSWPDLSGNSRHATQASGTLQPSIISSGINGVQVRRFDGIDDEMTISYSYAGTSLSVFWVAQQSGFTSGELSGAAFATPSTYDFASSGNFITAYISGSSMLTYRNGGLSSATTPGNNVPFIAGTVFNGSTNTFYLNGSASSSVSSSGSFSFSHIYLGRRWYQNIFSTEDLGDFIVIPSAISSGDIASLVAKWATKYSITI